MAKELDPTKRAAEDLTEAVEETLTGSEDIAIIDPKLKEKSAEREAVREASKPKEEKVRAADMERTASPIVKRTSSRNDARLLIITRDTGVFTENSQSIIHIAQYAQMFAEVHVIVLTTRKEDAVYQTTRVGDDIYLYPTNSRWWWKTIGDAKKVAKKQLVFGESFRPDLIIAEDPFESGMAGKAIARAYNRPLEVRVTENFLDNGFVDLAPHNRWRRFMAHIVLPKAVCVRTGSEYLKDLITAEFKAVKDRIEVLPIFYDIESWKTAPQTINLKEKFPQFKLILLHVSAMNERSHTESVIDGLYYILRQYKSLGLVIIGEGPKRAAIEERVAEYGLSTQVVFASKSVDVLSSMHSSDMLIHASSDPINDEVVLKGATVGIPMICGNVGIAAEVFKNEESVLLCPLDSPPCFGEKVNRLLNNNALRETLEMNARTVVAENIVQDYTQYLRVYRQSIERCLV
ncbi:glycosyltransferase family 4 protein [Candidatus Kaiserbacteria bacterium]|nr:glycosyltransferase family 4 protein [Candidatus Kaiserbacteria bacterium]